MTIQYLEIQDDDNDSFGLTGFREEVVLATTAVAVGITHRDVIKVRDWLNEWLEANPGPFAVGDQVKHEGMTKTPVRTVIGVDGDNVWTKDNESGACHTFYSRYLELVTSTPIKEEDNASTQD